MKVILIQILLFMVLLVGAPVPRSVKDFSHEILRRVGLDVPMTPLTADMAMMTDSEKKLIYKKNLQVIVSGEGGFATVIPPQDINFQLHKIPFNLYYEMRIYGDNPPESRYFICQSLEKLTGFKIVTFSMGMVEQRAGLYESQICPQ